MILTPFKRGYLEGIHNTFLGMPHVMPQLEFVLRGRAKRRYMHGHLLGMLKASDRFFRMTEEEQDWILRYPLRPRSFVRGK